MMSLQKRDRLALLRRLFNFRGMAQHAAEKQLTASRLISNEDRVAWRSYWRDHGQPWRTEPKIDQKRQQELTKLYATTPNINKGIYPFKDIKLSRADIEWLLAYYGFIDKSDEGCQYKNGLDLRGAILQNVDLKGLPLACIRGGLSDDELRDATLQQSEMAAIHLEDANLSEAHLENTFLYHAYLERANLSNAHLEGADCRRANLEGSNLSQAYIGTDEFSLKAIAAADLRMASFDRKTNLEDIHLGSKKFGFPLLADVNWGDANLTMIDWSSIDMLGDEREARHYVVPNKREMLRERLEKGRESEEVKQKIKEKKDKELHQMWLKDKQEAQQAWMEKKQKQISKYQEAIRTNRQLAAVLQTRGMNENATYFAYRAQVLKQWILRQALLEKNVQRDLSVIFVILVVVLVFTLLGGLVWLQIVTSQSNFCPPFPSSYASEYYSACKQPLPQKILMWIAALPQWLLLTILMFIGGILFLMLSANYIFQETEQENRWQLFPSLAVSITGIILLVVPPLALLPSVILNTNISLFSFLFLQWPTPPILYLTPSLTICLLFLSWKLLFRFIETFKTFETGSRSLSPFSLILSFVILLFIVSLSILSIVFTITTINFSNLYFIAIIFCLLTISLYFLMKYFAGLEKIQQIRLQSLDWLSQFIKTLSNYGQYTLSLFLDALAGYGYKPLRSLGWYIIVIIAFAVIYFLLGTFYGPTVSWNEALVVSLTAFHGRGFFSELFKPGDPQATAAAIEAVIGLIIEISFIATFTQRFFGK